VIVTVFFQIRKEAPNTIEGQRIECNLTETTRHVGGDDDTKQP